VALLLTDLQAGHSFDTIQFVIDREGSQALGALLEKVGLPPGTLHANESLRVQEVVPVGTQLQCEARLAQRSARGGWIVSVLESEIMVEGRIAVSTRATVLSPAGPA
jgi:hypothetical protein